MLPRCPSYWEAFGTKPSANSHFGATHQDKQPHPRSCLTQEGSHLWQVKVKGGVKAWSLWSNTGQPGWIILVSELSMGLAEAAIGPALCLTSLHPNLLPFPLCHGRGSQGCFLMNIPCPKLCLRVCFVDITTSQHCFVGLLCVLNDMMIRDEESETVPDTHQVTIGYNNYYPTFALPSYFPKIRLNNLFNYYWVTIIYWLLFKNWGCKKESKS